jgi:hypothetical protein
MAHLDHNSAFQKWELSTEEYLQGSMLTVTQKQCIQNQICDLAHRKLNLVIDLENPAKTAAVAAELSGQIIALQYLLTLSANAEQELIELRLTGHVDPSGV